MVEAILRMAKPNIDAAAARYQRCVENGNKGKDFGKEGGRPRKGETKEEYDERKRLLKTPRKPLDDDNNEKIDITGNKTRKDITSYPSLIKPSASSSGFTPKAETCSVSGSTIRLSFYDIGNSSDQGTYYYTNAQKARLFNRLGQMNDDEFERQYDDNISRIAWGRVEGDGHTNESLYATEAALMCQYYEHIPFERAKELVQQDANAKILNIQERRRPENIMHADDDDQPF